MNHTSDEKRAHIKWLKRRDKTTFSMSAAIAKSAAAKMRDPQ